MKLKNFFSIIKKKSMISGGLTMLEKLRLFGYTIFCNMLNFVEEVVGFFCLVEGIFVVCMFR